MRLGLLPGDPVCVEGAEALDDACSALLGEPVTLAFRIGTPGAYQKVAALVLDSLGRPTAFAKIAAGALAVDKVKHEASILRRLALHESVAPLVPRVLGTGETASSVLLLITVAPDRRGPLRWNRLHGTFLDLIHQKTGRYGSLRSSGLWRNLQRSLPDFYGTLSDSWSERIDRAMEALADGGATETRLQLTHRDFTPWNTRVDDQGRLFTFDWEFAESDYPAAIDELHFAAMRSAVGNSKAARLAWIRATDEAGRLLSTAYLTDMSMLYLRARQQAPKIGSNRFIDWLGNEMDRILRGSG